MNPQESIRQISFRLLSHSLVDGVQIVEVWRGKELVATIYPQETSMRKAHQVNPQESIRRARRALREPISTAQMQIVVPLIPPSVNMYKRPNGSGHGYHLTRKAKDFKAAVASLSRGSVDAKLYYVRVNIYLGKGDRGDGDNFNKCVGDALVDARIIHSDAKIKKWDVEKFRDREEPRTEILIWPWDENFVPVSPSVALDTIGFVQALEAEQALLQAAEAMTGALPVNGIERPGRPCRTHGALFCRQCHGSDVQNVQNVQNVQEKKPAQSEPGHGITGAVEPAWPAADSPPGTFEFDANIDVNVSLSSVECVICGKVPSFLMQIDGNEGESYIGRFLCRKHLLTVRRHFWDSLTPSKVQKS